MEEILASIRRIIEDSDNTRAEASGEPPVAAQPSSIPPAANSSRPSPAAEEREVDTFRRDLSEPKPAPVAAAPSPAKPAPQAKTDVLPSRTDSPTRIERPLQSVRAEQPVRSEASLTSEVMQREWRQRLAMPLSPVAAPAEEVVVPAPVPVAAAAAPEPAKGSILSEVTGRQVAAAFGELSEAFAATGRRSFDEVAEEMLRPMLQDWLDNNLPTLVERLVREEIERVARGNPR